MTVNTIGDISGNGDFDNSPNEDKLNILETDIETTVPLFLVDQISPTNLADITVDGNYCVRNSPADLVAQGITGHTRGDILRRTNGNWTFVLSPTAGVTIVILEINYRNAIFSDDPTAGQSPLFVTLFDTGEPFSVAFLGTDLPGQIGFDGTEITGNVAGGLTTANFNDIAVVLVSGSIPYWISDTVNPESSGVYNLVVNDAGTGDYTLRRMYGFRDSNNFTDGQTFFVGISGGTQANKNYLIVLDQQFIINTGSIAIKEDKITNHVSGPTSSTDNAIARFDLTTGKIIQNSLGILNDTGELSGLTKLTVDNVDINGNIISVTETNGDLTLDASAAGSGVVKITDQLEIEGETSQLLLTDTDNAKTFIVKNNLGDFSITQIGGNNSFKIKNDAASDSVELNVNKVTIGSNTRLVVETTIQIKGGNPGVGKALISDANGLASWEDTSATESFLFSAARFFGELGLPSSNENGNWTEVNGAEITLITDTVKGVLKQVVSMKDTTVATPTSAELTVTAAQWLSMFTFGGQFGGRVKCITPAATNNIFFMGVGVSGANNPTVSASNQRFGAAIEKDAATNFIVINETEGPLFVVLDGTGGVPLVEIGDYLDISVSLDINFTDPRWIVNGIDIGPAVIANNSNTIDLVTISSGSSAGIGNDFNVDNFGITILEESTAKTISLTSMAADVIRIITPPIIRDFEIIIPDGAGRKVGSVISLILNNVGGKFTIRASDLGTPQALVNGLRSFTANVTSKKEVSLVNTIENSNVYEGEGFEETESFHHSGIVSIETDGLNPITILSATDFRISPIEAVIVERSLSTKLQINTRFSLPQTDHTITGGGDQVVHIHIDKEGSYVFDAAGPVPGDVTDSPHVGNVVMNAGVITTVVFAPLIAYGSSVDAMAELLGRGGQKTEGSVVSGNFPDLTIGVTSGHHQQLGRGFLVNNNSPNQCDSLGEVVFAFLGSLGALFLSYVDTGGNFVIDSVQSGILPLIDPARFNNAGVLDNVPTNNFTAIRLIQFCQTGDIVAYYGTVAYANLAAAESGFLTEDPELFADTGDGSWICTILVKKNATRLDATGVAAGDVKFIGRSGRRDF